MSATAQPDPASRLKLVVPAHADRLEITLPTPQGDARLVIGEPAVGGGAIAIALGFAGLLGMAVGAGAVLLLQWVLG